MSKTSDDSLLAAGTAYKLYHTMMTYAVLEKFVAAYYSKTTNKFYNKSQYTVTFAYIRLFSWHCLRSWYGFLLGGLYWPSMSHVCGDYRYRVDNIIGSCL